MFECKKQRYMWDEDRLEFVKLSGLDYKITAAALHKQLGLDLAQQYLRYGNWCDLNLNFINDKVEHA